jgi:hypothetical protein
MVRTYAEQVLARFGILVVALILGASMWVSVAQDGSLNLIQTAEYDIGWECPVAAALDAEGTTLWTLMNNCGSLNFVLRAYNVADGTQANTDDYADDLAVLRGVYIDPWITPMAFTPEGDLSIYYNDPDTYESIHTLIPLATGGETITAMNPDYVAFLAGYSEYPDFSIYSPDHTRIIAIGATSFHILDVQAQTEIVEIPVEGGTDYAIAQFSYDGERLEVIHYDTLDVVDDFSSQLLIYSLPDGELLNEYPMPSSAIYISPDGAYAAVNLFSSNIGDLNELIVIDLETGASSAASNLDEAPHRVTTCANDGRDISDVDFTTTGRFTYPGMYWLPDSSGLVVPLSYGGEGAGGGASCYFNTSRVRTYSVEGAG